MKLTLVFASLTLLLCSCSGPEERAETPRQPAPTRASTSAKEDQPKRVEEKSADTTPDPVIKVGGSSAVVPKGDNETKEDDKPKTQEELATLMLEEPERAAKMIKKLWERGSGYSENMELLLSAQKLSAMQIFGEVIHLQCNNCELKGYDLHNYERRSYLVHIERIVGKSEVTLDDGKTRKLVVGDRVWFDVRFVSGDKPAAEEIVRKGSKVWACFDRPPLQGRSFHDDRGLAVAWTRNIDLQRNYATRLSWSMVD